MLKINNNEIAVFETMSWAFSTGGEHYYGYVYSENPQGEHLKYQLDYPMTKHQAYLLNQKDGEGSDWEEGESSQRYWREEDARRDAIKYFNEVLVPQGYKILVEGNFATAQPQPVIAYVEDYKVIADKFNDLYNEGQKVGWMWERHPRMLDSLCKNWNDYIIY